MALLFFALASNKSSEHVQAVAGLLIFVKLSRQSQFLSEKPHGS